MSNNPIQQYMLCQQVGMEVKQMNSKKIITVLISVIALMAFIVTALPEGPGTFDQVRESRRAAVGSQTDEAFAGNVTELDIAAVTVTQTWAGYYGNVSGTITLDDSAGKTMFDWALASPEGEIFAVNSSTTPDWNNIECFNFTADENEVNLTQLEGVLGLASDDVDGVDETFDEVTHPTFYVGEQTITTNTCPGTNIYDESEAQSADFRQVLLYDTTNNNMVYTALLEEADTLGFDNEYHDFQMLVGEDGHNADVAITDYYFYVELE